MKSKIIALFAALSVLTLAGCSGSGTSSVSSEPEESTTVSESIPEDSSEESEISVSVEGESSMYLGRTQTLSVTILNAEDPTAYYQTASGGTDVISVDGSGNVTAVGVGSDTVIVLSAEDRTKSASLYITVSIPDFDTSSVTIDTDYTATVTINGSTTVYRINSQGYIIDDEGYWFYDDKIYWINEDEDGTLYFEYDKYITDSNGDPYSASAYLTFFSIKDAVASSEWVYYGYETVMEGADTYMSAAKDGTDGFGNFVAELFVSGGNGYSITVDDEGEVEISVWLDDEIAASVTFEDVGCTKQLISPEGR